MTILRWPRQGRRGTRFEKKSAGRGALCSRNGGSWLVRAGAAVQATRSGLPERRRATRGRPSSTRCERRFPWWSWGESNPRPLECHSSALPTELQPRRVAQPIAGPPDCKERFASRDACACALVAASPHGMFGRPPAGVAELAYAGHSKCPGPCGLVGSNPTSGTTVRLLAVVELDAGAESSGNDASNAARIACKPFRPSGRPTDRMRRRGGANTEGEDSCCDSLGRPARRS